MIAVGISDWSGTFHEGTGTISTKTHTLQEAPYTYASRFDGAPGVVPEELFAAGHAGCFNHAFANVSGQNDLTVEALHTTAELTMGTDDHGPAILSIQFIVDAKLPGASEEKFQEIAEKARAWCAFSKALKVDITMKATLVS